MPSVVVTVEGVQKRWGTADVLAGVDLRLRAGTLVRIKGANGAGKTTLLRILAGLVVPDAGRVHMGELDPERDRRDYLRRLGFVSTGDRGIYPRLSARANLRLCAGLALMGRRESELAVEAAVAAFELAGHADRRADRTSMGQRQRTRLAMAFVHEPEVVLLDEPANSLDDDGIAVLDAALTRLKGRGGAAISAAPATIDAPLGFDERLVLSGGALTPE